jgi:hypothetical protein
VTAFLIFMWRVEQLTHHPTVTFRESVRLWYTTIGGTPSLREASATKQSRLWEVDLRREIAGLPTVARNDGHFINS